MRSRSTNRNKNITLHHNVHQLIKFSKPPLEVMTNSASRAEREKALCGTMEVTLINEKVPDTTDRCILPKMTELGSSDSTMSWPHFWNKPSPTTPSWWQKWARLLRRPLKAGPKRLNRQVKQPHNARDNALLCKVNIAPSNAINDFELGTMHPKERQKFYRA